MTFGLLFWALAALSCAGPDQAAGPDAGAPTAEVSFGAAETVEGVEETADDDPVQDAAPADVAIGPRGDAEASDVVETHDVAESPDVADDDSGDGDADEADLEVEAPELPIEECPDPHFAPPDCETCLPDFTGEACDTCADPHLSGPECDECSAEFTGPDCDECANAVFTGPECDECADPQFTLPTCTNCLPQFTGVLCDQCANPHYALPACVTCLPQFVGNTCEECADDEFTGTDCDECANPHYEAPECEDCLPAFKGWGCSECVAAHYAPPDCTECLPVFTGDDCDACANPNYVAPNCTQCLPQFAGNGCSQCADPHFALPGCDTCAAGFTGVACDECADPTFTGAECDQCTNPNFAAPGCDTCVPEFTGPDCDECADCAEPIGCSDGARDELYDLDTWPTVAACEGTFGFMSLRAERTNTACGDELDIECEAPEDLCSQGWHICMRNGLSSDLRFRLTWQECHSLSKPFVAASNNCSNPPSQNPAGAGCNMTEPFGCYETGWCSAPPVCGPFETSHCAHGVWPTKTYIFGLHAGKTVNKGCGNISTSVSIDSWSTGPIVSLAGVLCCQD